MKEAKASSKKVIAIIGSRNYPNLFHVTKWLSENTATDDIVVSGGAPGVDKHAERHRVTGGEVIVIRPDPAAVELLGWARALLARNAEIVALADIVVAFWDGKSRGTKDAIDKAHRLGKPVTIIRSDGVD